MALDEGEEAKMKVTASDEPSGRKQRCHLKMSLKK